MNKTEVIAKQAMQIMELRRKVKDFKGRAKRAMLFMVCVGGPLNDNLLGYNSEQKKLFVKICDALDGIDKTCGDRSRYTGESDD